MMETKEKGRSSETQWLTVLLSLLYVCRIQLVNAVNIWYIVFSEELWILALKRIVRQKVSDPIGWVILI